MAQGATQPTTQTMTINLRKSLLRLHTARRRKRAAGLVREAVARFSKSDPETVVINRELSEFIAKNASGASFLWAKLKINVEKSADRVEAKIYGQKAQVAAPAAAAKAEQKKTEEKKPQKKAETEAKQKPKETKEPRQQKQA